MLKQTLASRFQTGKYQEPHCPEFTKIPENFPLPVFLLLYTLQFFVFSLRLCASAGEKENDNSDFNSKLKT
jgi:hypothetical protein